MRDPGLQSLRRAARVALIVPPVFAVFLEVLDNPVAALFASFGAFALLGFADFGGPPRARTGAYLALGAVGAVLVLIGTLVSNEPVVAAVIGVAVAGAARFSGGFGGYFGASVSPVILAYVLAATVPAPAGAIPDRLLGWVVATVLATLAALVLWPRRERLQLREAAATTAGALADEVELLGTPDGPTREARAAVEQAVTTLVERSCVPQRPAGPSAHDAALAFLVDQLERIAALVRTAPPTPAGPEAAALAALGARTLRRIEQVLRTAEVPGDLDELVAACLDAKAGVIDRATEALDGGAEPGEVLDRIDDLAAERIVALIAASALANASILVSGRGPASGAATVPLEVPRTASARGTVARLRELVAANAVPTSAWAQEGLRAGIAVGAAILIAGELQLDHGFWVVLGTLSVLRSNAFDTGRTAAFAAMGTALGFAISAALLAVVGFDDAGLWVIVVAGFFLAAYTPQVVGFLAGQVCFTIALVAMFNLIEPQGWHTGLVRLENIVIGASVSALVALLFWPRRASVGLRANLAELYRELSVELPARLAQHDAEANLRAAELRAHVSYVQFLSETARAPAGRGAWAALLANAAQVRFATDALPQHRRMTRLDVCGPTRSAFRVAVERVAAALAATAARLDGSEATGSAADLDTLRTETRAPVCECLAHHAHEPGPDGVLAAGVDAALVRDLLIDVAVLADDALDRVASLPS